MIYTIYVIIKMLYRNARFIAFTYSFDFYVVLSHYFHWLTSENKLALVPFPALNHFPIHTFYCTNLCSETNLSFTFCSFDVNIPCVIQIRLTFSKRVSGLPRKNIAFSVAGQPFLHLSYQQGLFHCQHSSNLPCPRGILHRGQLAAVQNCNTSILHPQETTLLSNGR